MAACTHCRSPRLLGTLWCLNQPPPCRWKSSGQPGWPQKAAGWSLQPCSLGPCIHRWRWYRRRHFFSWPGLLEAPLLCPREQSTVHLLNGCHICHWLPVEMKAVFCAKPSDLEVSYGETDAWSNVQPMLSDWAWLRHDKWVSDRLHHLNLLTSTVTYIFPFGEKDVLRFYGSVVAWDLECFPIKADNSLQTADCEGQRQRHIFQLLFQRDSSVRLQHSMVFWQKIEFCYSSKGSQVFSSFCMFDIYQ